MQQGRTLTATAAPNEVCRETPDVRITGLLDCGTCCEAGPLLGFLGNRGGATFRGRAVLHYTVRDGDRVTEGELLSLDEVAPADNLFFRLDSDLREVALRVALFDEAGVAVGNCSGEGL